MTITQFLALFPFVKDTKSGWTVNCPAHEDHHPSLSVTEGEGGRIVLYCRAHCETRTICERLGIGLPDLFPDRQLRGHAKPLRLPPIKRSPVKLACAFELHACDLETQADKILAVAGKCEDCETWTNDDRDLAMKAVSRAYAYRERAAFCKDYADHLREQEHESKRLASCQS